MFRADLCSTGSTGVRWTLTVPLGQARVKQNAKTRAAESPQGPKGATPAAPDTPPAPLSPEATAAGPTGRAEKLRDVPGACAGGANASRSVGHSIIDCARPLDTSLVAATHRVMQGCPTVLKIDVSISGVFQTPWNALCNECDTFGCSDGGLHTFGEAYVFSTFADPDSAPPWPRQGEEQTES